MAELTPRAQRVLDAIGGEERSSAELAAATGLHQTSVAGEVRKLIDAGLVEMSGRRANALLYRRIQVASGPPRPYEPAVCECGDIATVHALNGRGMRAKCSASGCACKLFVAAEAVSGRG